jgi:hypothetical protein
MQIALSYADGLIDTKKLRVAFREFVKASKNTKFCKQNTFMCFALI